MSETKRVRVTLAGGVVEPFEVDLEPGESVSDMLSRLGIGSIQGAKIEALAAPGEEPNP